MKEIYSKTINFVLQIPEESSFVSLCTGMVHHGSEFKADITIQVEKSQKVDLKSILGIMTLCYANGRHATIEIKGTDAEDVEAAYMCLNKYVETYSHS